MGPWWGSQGPRRGPRKPLQAAKICKKCPKNPPKKEVQAGSICKIPSATPCVLEVGERAGGFKARACEREVDTTAQRAESPVEVQEQREREQKRIGMGQVSAMCARAPCSRAPACTPHTQHAHARRSRALPVTHQKLGPGGGKGLLVATGHGRRRRRSRSKQRSPLPADL